MKSEVFGIIGGDRRQIYLAKSILKDNYPLYVCGFDNIKEASCLPGAPLNVVLELSDNIILPLPVSRDGETIFAPYSSEPIKAGSEFIIALSGKNVYGGMMN